MTTEIRFYHLERQTLDEVLPSLLSKALESGKRIVVKAANDKEVERLNDHLWVYNPNSFIPHGSQKNGEAERQPVWLTSIDENPNSADVLILCQGTNSAIMKNFALCCEMLDGRDADAASSARARWKQYKDDGFTVTYWQQGAKGWEKKA